MDKNGKTTAPSIVRGVGLITHHGLITSAGTTIAFPLQTTYLSTDRGLDTRKAQAAELVRQRQGREAV